MWNVAFLVTGFLFLILLIMIFLSKQVINSIENKIFKFFIVANVFEYLTELPLQLIVRFFGVDSKEQRMKMMKFMVY